MTKIKIWKLFFKRVLKSLDLEVSDLDLLRLPIQLGWIHLRTETKPQTPCFDLITGGPLL